jgi:transcriptional regulator NrdR family protein
MMDRHTACPECDSYDTEVVDTQFYRDMIERVRICNDCPTQWVVSFSDPIVQDVQTFDEEEVSNA